jgi:hypothetical protein
MHLGIHELLMQDERPLNDDESLAFLEERGVKLKKSTWRSYRCKGMGPRFYLDSGHPRYFPSWLNEFIIARTTFPASKLRERDACAA